MITFNRTLRGAIAVAFLATSAVVVMGQERKSGTDDGSLVALITEVRELRLAVEESARRQTQTQALGIYLSAQQARLVQTAARLDSARKELDAVTVRAGELADQLASLEDVPLNVDSPQRAQVAREIAAQAQVLKREQGRVAVQQQEAQAREAELLQMHQAEDARWGDLISRLEQLARK